MITDIEMEVMNKLIDMCSNEYDKDVLRVCQDLLAELETDKFYAMSEDSKNNFVKPFAKKINELRHPAVRLAQAQGLTNAVKEHYANGDMAAAYECWCGLYSLFVPAVGMDEKSRLDLFVEQQKFMVQIDNETVYAVTDYGKRKFFAETEKNQYEINENSDGIVCEGHFGTWYVIETEIIDGIKLFLLEHEEYGDEAACIIVDENGKVVCEDVCNGFDDYVDMRLCELQDELKNVINEREGLSELSDRGIFLDNAYFEIENHIQTLLAYDADASCGLSTASNENKSKRNQAGIDEQIAGAKEKQVMNLARDNAAKENDKDLIL